MLQQLEDILFQVCLSDLTLGQVDVADEIHAFEGVLFQGDFFGVDLVDLVRVEGFDFIEVQADSIDRGFVHRVVFLKASFEQQDFQVFIVEPFLGPIYQFNVLE